MKGALGGFLPFALAGLGLAAFAFILFSEVGAFRSDVASLAERDVQAQAELAAKTLEGPLAAGDFRPVGDFGSQCRRSGARLTVYSAQGGVVFDSEGAADASEGPRPEVADALASGVGSDVREPVRGLGANLYCARRAGDYVVRLARPLGQVDDLVGRARSGHVVSALAAVCGIALVLLAVRRMTARLRLVALERDRKERLLAEMRKAEDFRRAFVSDLAHEIRTPLSGIVAAVDLLGAGDALPAPDRRTLYGMLRTEAGRLNDLAQDILSLARLESGQGEPRRAFAEADLSDVLASVAERLRPRAAAAGVALEAAPSAPAVVLCDASLVEQALANLVENAILHSGSPDVALSLDVRGDRTVLSVEDHGAGIAPEHRERVFERFYRVDEGRSREQGGTGLGLAIVKHVARLHGGDATLSTPASGRGCRFELSLPCR